VKYEQVHSQPALEALCGRLADAARIGFDTEFVSEDSYWPELCLVQVVTDDSLAVIDAGAVESLQAFWQVLAEPGHQTICHAGREELLFSLNAIGRPPADLFDIQLAAGMVGFEYPAGYGSLINKLLGIRPPKGETRTDWRKRPLTERQLEYAVADVQYLLPAADRLEEMVHQLDRADWLRDEINAWQAEVAEHRERPRWRRVSGISGLSGKSLAIVRELWHWREAEAQRQNRPPRRILRDDLIVEIAKRASADPKRITSIRGIERTGLKRRVGELSACVEQALQSPESRPRRSHRPGDLPSQLQLLGQFLTAALTSICHRAQVAPSLVGTASDVRELIAHRLGYSTGSTDELPTLACGWRADVVGHTLEDLLAGKTSIRIVDPLSDQPLAFQKAGEASRETDAP